MKKIMSLMLMLLALVSFIGCEQSNPDVDPTTTGQDVQITQGDPGTGDEYEDDDDDGEEDDDDDD